MIQYCSQYTHTEALINFSLLINIVTNVTIHINIAVSYTHLDVYKRQVYRTLIE